MFLFSLSLSTVNLFTSIVFDSVFPFPPIYVKIPEEEKEIYPAYPKSSEKNGDFVNRIMNSKAFEPQNAEEKSFFEETSFEISNLKTLGLLSYRAIIPFSPYFLPYFYLLFTYYLFIFLLQNIKKNK